jgi:N-acyl-D-glutamate deacylase
MKKLQVFAKSAIAGIMLISFGCGTQSSTPPADGYDIVILNGRVMDPETNFDEVRNVGIKDGIIVSITEEPITGKETIDATDHVVAPGFIDTHVHSSEKFSIKMSMMDGVTSGMDLEAGCINTAAWYDREKGKWPINYGQCVSQEMVRMLVHDKLDLSEPVDAMNLFDLRAQSLNDGIEGWSVTVSTLDQINEISKILDENLRQGAIGLGSTVGYASKGISTYEMFEAQKVAARYKRVTAVHNRLHTSSRPPLEATMGFDEIFTNSSLLQAPLLVCHNNDYGWWEIEEKLQMARKLGMNMWSEYYPYTAGATAIAAEALRPESLEGMLGLTYDEVIYDPYEDKMLNKEEYLKTTREDPGRTIIAFNPAREKWMPHWIKMPHMTVGSDAMWNTNPEITWDSDPAKFIGHPRTSGSHSTALQLARDAEVPLMFSLSQLSYWSAKHLGDAGLEAMQKRGRMQEGMIADITIFNPETVKPGSSYKNGEHGLPPAGIPHVLVNGQFVKRDNQATNVMAGVPIRYPVEEEPRFVPASKEEWIETFTIDDGAVYHKPVALQESQLPQKVKYNPLMAEQSKGESIMNPEDMLLGMLHNCEMANHTHPHGDNFQNHKD